MTGKNHYIEGDGNGGFRISNSMIALASLVMLLVGGLASSVIAFSDVSNKVDNLASIYEEAGPRHTAVIGDIREDIEENEDRIQENEKTNAILKDNIKTIKENIEDIKSLIDKMDCQCD